MGRLGQALTLEEYARLHPKAQEEPETERRARQVYEDRQQEREEVIRLKQAITRQLEEGTEPQFILFTAMKAIGVMTHDKAWVENGKRILDSIYADLAQQSFLTDTAAIEAQRLDDMQADYREKLKKQLNRNLNGCGKIERALREALKELDGLDKEDKES